MASGLHARPIGSHFPLRGFAFSFRISALGSMMKTEWSGSSPRGRSNSLAVKKPRMVEEMFESTKRDGSVVAAREFFVMRVLGPNHLEFKDNSSPACVNFSPRTRATGLAPQKTEQAVC